MKSGATLVEVLQSVKSQAATARDMVVDTRALSMAGGRLQLATSGEYDVRDMAHVQIAERLGIPAPFYKRLRDESGSLLEHLCAGGDFSRWGVANAVTRLSQDVASYDRATELERAGGSLLSPANPVWASVKN